MTFADKDRLSVLEAYETVVQNARAIIDIITDAPLQEDARAALIRTYALNEAQAEAVLRLPLGALVLDRQIGLESDLDLLLWKKHAGDRLLTRETLHERYSRLNRHFAWTEAHSRAIIALNNGLLERYREAYNELVRVKNEFESRYRAGDTRYQDYTLEVEMWYNAPDGLSEAEDALWNALHEQSHFWGCARLHYQSNRRTSDADIESFEQAMCIDDHSWDEYPFNVPALDGTYIYFCMHDIFNHNTTYSLADAVRMKAEDFSWQLNIALEHWGKSAQDAQE